MGLSQAHLPDDVLLQIRRRKKIDTGRRSVAGWDRKRRDLNQSARGALRRRNLWSVGPPSSWHHVLFHSLRCGRARLPVEALDIGTTAKRLTLHCNA